ncbi:diphosphate--fructose-6-phosphate 1-phosphotransferase [Alkalihalophilus sp. As8PL]|uniref:Diphosphate--fructose-6-phosphate 1-phosphotransferase n=1 Tax=Alkalihalophilus sp. As8PL TaxID=3237103 RepID=A0AB39BPJ2_9BACI
MKNIAIGQAGGPTSVINTTLVGFVKQAMKRNKLHFIKNGYEGLTHGQFSEGNETILKWILDHEHIPGACLGSGRYSFTDENISTAVRHLKKMSIDTLVFIGGNGTMEALNKVGIEAARQKYDLQVIGLPKTVDNDLGCTDHAPGFGSAAKFVAQATRDLSRDLYSMKNFEQVRILETMGRNAGWLAAASGFFKTTAEEGPHFIALPEKPLDQEQLLKAVKTALTNYGYAVVVVSEGVAFSNGKQLQHDVVGGRAILGGISKQIEQFLKEELKATTRAELLGMSQRSFSQSVSSRDIAEAYQVGVVGASWVEEGLSNVMVSMERAEKNEYEIVMKPASLQTVASCGERVMPLSFIDNLEAYYKWLAPIIGDPITSYPPLAPKNTVFTK